MDTWRTTSRGGGSANRLTGQHLMVDGGPSAGDGQIQRGDAWHGRKPRASPTSALIATVDLSEEHAAIAAFAAAEAVERAMLWADPEGAGAAEWAASRQLTAVTADGTEQCMEGHDLGDAVAAGRFRSRGGGYRHGRHPRCWRRQLWCSGVSEDFFPVGDAFVEEPSFVLAVPEIVKIIS